MMKKIISISIFFITIFCQAQVDNSYWVHVGPISTNLEDLDGKENKFETGRMEFIAINPNNTDEIFIGCKEGGLWRTTDQAEHWENISTIPIETNGVSAVTFNKSNEVIVANFVKYQWIALQTNQKVLNHSTGLFKYNTDTEEWTALGSLPIIDRKYVVNSIVTHPENDNLILVGTTHGMYRSTDAGATWTLVPTAHNNIEEIQFVLDYSTTSYYAFYTGTKMDIAISSDIQVQRYFGDPIMAKSNDDGLTFNEVAAYSAELLADYTVHNAFTSTFCLGKSFNVDESVFYIFGTTKLWGPTLTGTTGIDRHFIYKVIYNYTTGANSCEVITSYHEEDVTTDRMAIAYDDVNQRIWYGGTKIRYLETEGPDSGVFNTSSHIYFPTYVHADIHDVIIHPSNPELLYLVSDGGFYINDLNTPNEFTHKNYGINEAIINGFSGSAKNPDFYLIGLQDIVHTSLFDGEVNWRSHFTWENDGGLIDIFNEDILILDESSYDANYRVSNDGGGSITVEFGSPESYETSFGLPHYFQDPYRERLFAGYNRFSLSQFDFDHEKFTQIKCRIGSGPWPDADSLTYNSIVSGMAFSKTNENSVHVISSVSFGDTIGPNIAKYVGENFEEMGPMGYSDELYYGDFQPQWKKITPDWQALSNLSGSFNSISPDDLNTFAYTGIAKSNLDDNTIFVTCSGLPENSTVKVIKYDDHIWTDYSEGIPEDQWPSSIVIDSYSNDGLYLVTERAVYYRDANMEEWMLFNSGYPKLYGNQMEINQLERTLRIGTFGRGIWKTNLKCPEDVDHTETGMYPENQTVEGRNIFSDAHVNIDIDVFYKANTCIQLRPGFTASSGSRFRARIQECISSPPSMAPFSNAQFERTTEEKLADLVNEDTHPGFTVYPNPTHGEFIVDFGEILDVSRIDIFDLSGRIILSEIAPERSLNLNLSEEQKGVYFVRVISGNQTLIKHIILN